MEEEMISKEMVKPSSPTPHHLKIHKLSFLDQIAPPVYVPLIFFYQKHPLSETLTLKHSLSETLTRFPPLAGRIQENSFIVCNDEGAEFIESHVHTRLDQVIQNPKMEALKQLLPIQPLIPDHAANPVVAVKISWFDCGGISVGVCLSHKIADGTSLVHFIKTWAAMSNGVIPNTNTNTVFAVDYFPPIDLSGSKITPQLGVSNEKITTRRLVFDREKLAKLKQIAAVRSGVKNPSRVEAVSGFIWGHFIEAADETKSVFVGVHAVSLRGRAKPPIPEDVLGNCWSASFAYSEEEGRDLVRELRESIRGFDEGCVEKVRSGEYLRGLSETAGDLFRRETEICSFSSWCRFPVYEVDFGWGKPEWVCTATLPFKNLVILMSTPEGDGIEAWVNLPERDVEMLERRYSSIAC